MRYLVTKSFQFRGGVAKPGTVLKLDEQERQSAFVMAHVKALENLSDQPAPANDAVDLRGKQAQPIEYTKPLESMSLEEVRAELKKLNVHFSLRKSHAELSALLAAARESIAAAEGARQGNELF